MQEILLETQDAELLREGEEVTLMDWGNAIIKVRGLTWSACHPILGLRSIHAASHLELVLCEAPFLLEAFAYCCVEVRSVGHQY